MCPEINEQQPPPLENRQHAIQLGLVKSGRDHWMAKNPEKIRRGFKSHPNSIRVGAANNKAKITEETVRQIRAMSKDGATSVAIAKHFGISQAQAHNIISGKQWRHVQ